jgi:hypothetical protein
VTGCALRQSVTNRYRVSMFYVAQLVPAASESTVPVQCRTWRRDAAVTRWRGRLRYIICLSALITYDAIESSRDDQSITDELLRCVGGEA